VGCKEHREVIQTLGLLKLLSVRDEVEDEVCLQGRARGSSAKTS
jgi:hypothetical protein